MQRLLEFIENNIHLILFLLLQAVCAVLLFRLNPYQRAFISNSTADVTSLVNERSTNVKNFFNLRSDNEALQQLFADSLVNTQARFQLFHLDDTLTVKDSLNKPLYQAVPAQVVYNTINKAENVFVINRGRRDGISKGAGVMSASGVAGIVVAVGERFSTVMSVLNINFRIVPKINEQEFYTDVVWDNTNPYTLKINKINKLENVKEGDRVVTGNSSLIFPPDLPIGTVQAIRTKANSQYFDTDMTPATNFRDLRYVFVLTNAYRQEIEALLEDE